MGRMPASAGRLTILGFLILAIVPNSPGRTEENRGTDEAPQTEVPENSNGRNAEQKRNPRGKHRIAESARTPPTTAQSRFASLPTERTLIETLPGAESPATLSDALPMFQEAQGKEQFLERMRPIFSFETEWLAAFDDVGLFSNEATIQIPLYPVFGPPPPLLRVGYAQTDLLERGHRRLPRRLSDYSLGLSWVRRLDDRWTLRMMGNAALATDGDNTSSDAWQFRGGLFAIYSRDPRWIWTMGVLALGRNDLPAVPAVGVIWQPDETRRLDLILPRPRFRTLLVDGGTRQQWVYVGGGFSGGTWAYEQPQRGDDQLTYGDWRVVAGWESVPRAKPGIPFQRGRKLGVEVGYSFSREFEFESRRPTIPLENTLLLRATLTL